jgi:hypothetical protein
MNHQNDGEAAAGVDLAAHFAKLASGTCRATTGSRIIRPVALKQSNPFPFFHKAMMLCGSAQ